MQSVLLVIDVQRNMLEPPSPVPDAEAIGATIAEVIGQARAAGAQVVHIRNNGDADEPDAPGTEGWQLVHDAAEGEHVVDKWKSDAFDGTNLADIVPAGARVVAIGMQSKYCVRATALAAVQRGHDVTLVSGAHATYDEHEPAAEISRQIEEELKASGIHVIEANEPLFT
jgi:nicotinamidase-related amidase